MISRTTPLAAVWSELAQKTGQRSAVHFARAQWTDLSAATTAILEGPQRPLLSDETIELLRNARFEANTKAAAWNRKMSEIDAEIADLQRRLEDLDKETR